MQVDSTSGSMTDSLQARVGQNPEHALLLSEHRRLEKGRKQLENQVILFLLKKILSTGFFIDSFAFGAWPSLTHCCVQDNSVA